MRALAKNEYQIIQKKPAFVAMLLFFIFILGCAEKAPHYGERVHPAAYAMDLFTVDRAIPEHEKKNDMDFFFKRCSLEKRTNFNSQAEYSCNY